MSDPIRMDEWVRTHARNTDPITSQLAAARVKLRADKGKAMLLDVMADGQRRTVKVACRLAGFKDNHQRMSDLKNAGWVRVVGWDHKEGPTPVEIYEITESGLAKHKETFDV